MKNSYFIQLWIKNRCEQNESLTSERCIIAICRFAQRNYSKMNSCDFDMGEMAQIRCISDNKDYSKVNNFQKNWKIALDNLQEWWYNSAHRAIQKWLERSCGYVPQWFWKESDLKWSTTIVSHRAPQALLVFVIWVISWGFLTRPQQRDWISLSLVYRSIPPLLSEQAQDLVLTV